MDILANPVIAAHWDKSLTMAQNYRKLGLTSKLQKAAGGVERDVRKEDNTATKIKSTSVKTARIVKKDDGSTEIVYDNEEEEWTGFDGETTDVVRELEEYARHEVRKPRHQSAQEQDWLALLVDKYDDDYMAMQWDKKLNPFQKSAGDLKRRIYKWRKAQEA